jgi:hypothetical protein
MIEGDSLNILVKKYNKTSKIPNPLLHDFIQSKHRVELGYQLIRGIEFCVA